MQNVFKKGRTLTIPRFLAAKSIFILDRGTNHCTEIIDISYDKWEIRLMINQL